MKFLLTICLFILAGAAMAQNDFKPVNRDSVKLAISDSTKDTYYPKLFDRYNRFDTTLTLDEYRLIYYGFVFQDAYYAYASDKKREVAELLGKRSYDKASEVCDEALKNMPVGLTPNLSKSYVLFQMNVNDSASFYVHRYKRLRDAILSTGNGEACETAFKTIFVSDEYDIIHNYFDIESRGQSLVFPCDKLSVSKSKNWRSSAIYFDTSETFENMKKKFKSKE